MKADLADLIESTAELKGQLISFAQQPRFERLLRAALADAAAQEGDAFDDRAAFMVLDDFIFRHRMQDGTTIIDSFLRQSRHLTREERATLLAWRDPVEGLFEVQRQYEDSVLLLNLVDDLEYRVYSNMGPGVFRPVKRGAFVQGRIVPVRDVWVVSGMLAGLDKSRAAEVAGVAMELAVQIPRWAFRNEELLERNWAMMAEKRAEFIATFGSDEVLLAPGEVEKRMANLGYGGSAGPKLPEEAYRCETVAFVFDEDDGLAVFLDYGKLHDLFADPSLAKDRERADLLLGYLRSDSVNPCAVRRLAETYPEHADAVFQTVLKQRHFSWAAHGEALLRKHKPWYYEQDQLPAMLVFGKRLTQLLGTSARAVEALCGRCGHRRYDGCFLGCGRAGADRVGGATVCVHKRMTMAKDAFDVALAGFGRWVRTEPELWGDPHGDVRELELLFGIMRDQLGLDSPAALAPGHLQDLLLRAYVRKVGAGQTAETTAVVPALSDFFEYLAQNGDITADDADELDGRLEAVMRQFGSMAGDPTEMGLLDLRGAVGGVVGLKEAFALEDELPPLLLPPESQLADMVRRLPLLSQLTALTEWLGDDGRHVDEDLNLTPADAAEAAAVTGIDPASLPDLWDMALDSDFMDIADDRAVRDGDRDWRSRDDAEVVRLWQDLLGQVLVYTLTVIAEKDPELSEGLNFAGIGIGFAVLLFLARNEGMPVTEASDIVREAAIHKLSRTSEEEAERAWQAWIAAHGDPVRPLLDRLVSLGAASVTLDPEEGELIRLTHLGLYATRSQLVADGVDIPLLPEPEHLTASDLLGLGFSLPEEEFDAAMNRWLSGRAHETAAREVLAAGATGSVPDRMLAIGIAGDLGEAAAPAWREGLDQLPLRGYAKAALARLDGKEFPDDLVLDDYAWITTDTLVGAGFGSPHGIRSAADVATFLSEATPPGTEAELFEAMARLPHGQVADVLTVIGRSHPDKKLAKLARKAAYKATTRRSALSS